MLKLPNCSDEASTNQEIEITLKKSLKTLWKGGTLEVPHLELTEGLGQALGFARRCGKLKGGFENISTLLQREEAGLAALRGRGINQGQVAASRLLFVSNDGSERFYRSCESLLLKYGNRVLGIKLDVNSSLLGSRFFGKDALVKMMMIDRKEFVQRALLSLAPSHQNPSSGDNKRTIEEGGQKRFKQSNKSRE